jgi:hypothetical protein
LLFEAGKLLARKIAQSPGIQSHSIDVILEVGSGTYPGLGISLASALQQTPGVLVKDDVKVICNTWSDKEVSPVFRDARVLKVIIVTAARTPDLAKKMEEFISVVKTGMSTTSDVVVKICSLVCMDVPSGIEKHINGLLLIEE